MPTKKKSGRKSAPKRNSRLQQDTAAWKAGFAAGEAGRPSSRCPHPAASNEAWSWHSGWIEGDAKRRGRLRHNPQTAADLYEKFHGKPATKVREVIELERSRGQLADLGRLIEVEVKNSAGRFVLPFAGGVHLASAPDGRSLFFVGGDQDVKPAALGITADTRKDHLVLGECSRVVYHTSKAFHNFEPSDYEHKLGEESGVRPLLCFDGLNRLLYLVGGNYRVRPEGIVD